MTAWGGLYQHITKAVTTRMEGEPQDDMIDVLLSAEIDGVELTSDASCRTPCCWFRLA